MQSTLFKVNAMTSLNLSENWIGLTHITTAVFSMILGAVVILNKKGTTRHKKIGYAYFVNMILLNITAFGIYNFGSFSLFHFFALVSLFTIFMGMLPVWKRKKKNWLRRHFYSMNWSVVGLYCAFWAEVGTRLFDMRFFWWIVLSATLLTSAVGAILIRKEAAKRNLI